MRKLVLLRHGESSWNRENRFTGWADVGLTEHGLAEARAAGQLLKREGFDFDIAFTSVLRRAIKTLWTALEELDRMWIPIHHSWRLNERHYGALQGLDKAQTAARHGEAQVKVWRRAFDVAPPALPDGDPYRRERDRGDELERTRAHRILEVRLRHRQVPDAVELLRPVVHAAVVLVVVRQRVHLGLRVPQLVHRLALRRRCIVRLRALARRRART